MKKDISEGLGMALEAIDKNKTLPERQKANMKRTIKRAAECTNGEADKLQAITETLYYHIEDDIYNRAEQRRPHSLYSMVYACRTHITIVAVFVIIAWVVAFIINPACATNALDAMKQ